MLNRTTLIYKRSRETVAIFDRLVPALEHGARINLYLCTAEEVQALAGSKPKNRTAAAN